MTVRLGFAVSAFLEPEILVVDEVLAVGDTEFRKKAIGKMQGVSKGEGRTVLFVSHNMAAVKSLCATGVIMNNGMITYKGSSDEAVLHYLANSSVELVTHSVINNKHRRFSVLKEVEILEVALLNESAFVATNEPLIVELLLRKNKDIDSFSLEMFLENNYNVTVGSYISKFISTKSLPPEFRLRLTLSDHNLSRGIYSIGFNVGLKDLSVGLKDFDLVYNVLNFEIRYSDYLSKSPIVLWRDEWGSNHFQNGVIEIL
jgi:hypothetical protein